MFILHIKTKENKEFFLTGPYKIYIGVVKQPFFSLLGHLVQKYRPSTYTEYN